MGLISFLALGLAFTFYSVTAVPSSPLTENFPKTDEYPLPNVGNLQVHDPNILAYNDAYYAFKGGISIPYFKATNLSGPWTKLGGVLNGPSVIKKANPKRPWAPSVIERNGTFYCFYSLSENGSRNSAIGVATTDNVEGGPWADHGALIATGSSGLRYDKHPYSISNAIDPSVIIDPADNRVWFNWGSYWTDIWQVPLADDLLSVDNADAPDAKNIAFQTLPGKNNAFLEKYPVNSDPQGIRPVEGSFMSYKSPYYYLWFSHGKCCHFEKGLPPAGQEYSIRVGRSNTSVRGPFVDKSGKQLTEGGGTIVYGSNHGDVYAPGGLGILNGTDNQQDILYYHYLNKSIGLAHDDAQLGWNYLDYEDGWPVAKESKESAANGRKSPVEAPIYVMLLFVWVYVYS